MTNQTAVYTEEEFRDLFGMTRAEVAEMDRGAQEEQELIDSYVAKFSPQINDRLWDILVHHDFSPQELEEMRAELRQ